MITQEELKRLFHYDEETGDLTRLVKTCRGVKVGDIPRALNTQGYKRVRINSKLYYQHRLIFLYMEGDTPSYVDHINGDKSDNRWSNLRPATPMSNACNIGKRSNNTSGYKGVYWDKRRQKWCAKINVEFRNKHIGYFTTKEEAYSAYCTAAYRYHGDFANVT
jgi:hypothetical protein|tara:strand:- start:43 stop:531 length:489 start_codon:yes stop_codon:yes gene_type:complete